MLMSDFLNGKLEIEYNLALLRQLFWNILVQDCRSFANRNCNAQFSEIFSSSIFDKLLAAFSLSFLFC